MSVRKLLLAAAAAASLSGPVQAEGSRALQARSVDLGGLSGIAYYTEEANGYRVVVTLARHEASPAIRFETTLAAGQDTVLSIPRELGLQAQAIRIGREGDRIVIRQSVRETASAE